MICGRFCTKEKASRCCEALTLLRAATMLSQHRSPLTWVVAPGDSADLSSGRHLFGDLGGDQHRLGAIQSALGIADQPVGEIEAGADVEVVAVDDADECGVLRGLVPRALPGELVTSAQLVDVDLVR